MKPDKKIVIFVDNYFEDLELFYPLIRLRGAGFEVVVAGKELVEYSGKHGLKIKPDITFKGLSAKEYDAVVIPGGFAPDYLRRYEEVLKFIQEMNDLGKTISAICHGPQVLISAGVLKGREMTCFYAIKDDCINAGAKYVEGEPVVVDNNLITSRYPDDLEHFSKAIIEELGGK
jgi:protease I